MQFYIGSSLKNTAAVRQYAEILEQSGWKQTFDWTQYIREDVTKTDLAKLAALEQQAVMDADVVMILLPAGRGTHVELGLALAQRKKLFLCAPTKDAFSPEHTVSFYEAPGVTRLIGTAEENIAEILTSQ